ncbi:MAG TPA: HAMP domain-containing protein [Thermodesulfobacteriota bacterium]|jgi:HAMP domain-containing protein|nr:HAMP domain-containing protein [Thermodesulfobacteriota bacterium]
MAEAKRGVPAVSGPPKRLLGLRFKMFFLFFFVPIVLIIAAGLVYMNHVKTLSGLITRESSQLVTKMAEEAIAEKGRSVAKEVERYLLNHPDLKKEDYMQDPALKSIGIQKVGQTGYTCLVSKVLETEPSCLWLHPKQELIGKDIVLVMRKTLGDGYDRWFKIQDIAFRTGRESDGYYMWFDQREKYMVMVPVAGTNFFVASTTYIDEFTLPMTELQARANQLTARATRTVMIVLAATAILIALIVIIYSYRLSGRLKSLSDAADRISLGNIDVELKEIKSKDEIEDLADAFSRMQASIRLAIKRLRERE